MEKNKVYDVILETTASLDLTERVYWSIKDQVLSLDEMPYRFPLVREEPFASMGVRLMPVENYHAFYVIDEQLGEVHILRILYNRREWKNIL